MSIPSPFIESLILASSQSMSFMQFWSYSGAVEGAVCLYSVMSVMIAWIALGRCWTSNVNVQLFFKKS